LTPAELLQRLIRFDTTNPPGNEEECIAFVRGVLEDAGCEPELYAKDPARPNLVARVPGKGKSPPLLIQGHVDVVTTSGQDWQRPPFGGDLVDGEVWGRGAIDMKGPMAMYISAFVRAARGELEPPGDLILVVLADEENGGDFGAKFLVNVVPSRIDLELDGRLLPGFTPDDLIAEVRELIGDYIEFELVRHDSGPSDPDYTHFDMLGDVLRELDPEGIPMPLLQGGVTDARFFSQLGIQTYGFMPMRLADDFPVLRLVHAADERIPVAALAFGTEAVCRVLQRF